MGQRMRKLRDEDHHSHEEADRLYVDVDAGGLPPQVRIGVGHGGCHSWPLLGCPFHPFHLRAFHVEPVDILTRKGKDGD
jgi:hypothetical protein